VNPHYHEVAQRANHQCEYCHAPELAFNIAFEVDHIIPKSLGGQDDRDNLALACHACNRHKSSSIDGGDGRRARSVRLFNPRRDNWSNHFSIDVGSGILVALTDVARAAIRRLKMNDRLQISARLRWIQWGIYPSVAL